MREFHGAKLCGVLLVAATMILLLLRHTVGVNGPWYWGWEWRRAPAMPLYVLLPLAGLPVLLAQYIRRDRRSSVMVGLALLLTGTLILRYASVFVQTQPPGFELITTIIRCPLAMSYHTDALLMDRLDGWFGMYDQILRLPTLHLHTVSKPPGAVLFFVTLLQFFGDTQLTCHVAAAMLGLLASAAVPVTYWLIKILTNDTDVAFTGASFLALSPGFVLFFPMFDPSYILFSGALIGLWVKATTEASRVAAVGMGLVLALLCVVTFNVLVVGFFCALYPIVVKRVAFRQYISSSFIVILTAAAALGILGIVTGYDPIATFQSAWRNQHALLAKYADQRPYPATILFDLTDFALGSGWISFVLVLFYLIGGREHRALVYLCLGQLLLVAVTGLLQAETARVWNFMLPLLMIPVGLELSNWPARDRAIVLGSLLLVTSAICQNMKFIY